jgi:hypothetical protein
MVRGAAGITPETGVLVPRRKAIVTGLSILAIKLNLENHLRAAEVTDSGP